MFVVEERWYGTEAKHDVLSFSNHTSRRILQLKLRILASPSCQPPSSRMYLPIIISLTPFFCYSPVKPATCTHVTFAVRSKMAHEKDILTIHWGRICCLSFPSYHLECLSYPCVLYSLLCRMLQGKERGKEGPTQIERVGTIKQNFLALKTRII